MRAKKAVAIGMIDRFHLHMIILAVGDIIELLQYNKMLMLDVRLDGLRQQRQLDFQSYLPLSTLAVTRSP